MNRSIKRLIRNIIYYSDAKAKMYFFSKKITLSKKKRNFIILDVPTHPNIGDHVITIAEENFIKKHFPDVNLIILTDVKFIYYLRSLSKQISNSDVILLHGGGNLGSLYPSAERRRRLIYKIFSDSKIVMFPQSVFYENDSVGEMELRWTKKAISQVRDLTIFIREPISLKRIKKDIPNLKTKFVPDIVLSLPVQQDNKMDSGGTSLVVTLLREDIEAALKPMERKNLLSSLSAYFDSVRSTDMMAKDKVISRDAERAIVHNKFEEVASANLIVTDRLHGMLLAFLTNRKQIVFDNANAKVSSTYYQWLSEANTISFIKKFSDEELIKNVDSITKCEKESNNKIVSQSLSTYYKELINCLNQ